MFYAPAGHTAIVDEEVKFVDFSPTRELDELMANVSQKMAEMSG